MKGRAAMYFTECTQREYERMMQEKPGHARGFRKPKEDGALINCPSSKKQFQKYGKEK